MALCYYPAPPMKLIDVSVPLDANLPTYPGNTPFSLGSDQAPLAGRQLERVDRAHECALRHATVDAPRHFFDEAPGSEALPARDADRDACGVIEITSRKGRDG